MSERFTPQSIDADIDAALTGATAEQDAQVIQAIQALYAPPADADAALARVQTRLLQEQYSISSHEQSSGRLISTPTERHRQDVHAGRSGAATNRNATLRRRQLIGSLGALAAVLLVIVGFAHVFQSRPHLATATATAARLLNTPTPLPTVSPAAQPVPGKQVNWQANSFPVQVQQQTELGLAISPSDGATDYLCNYSSTHADIWVTHDRGIHWTQTSRLSVDGDVSVCALQVDTLSSSRLLMLIAGYPPTFSHWELSIDSGATWTQVPGSYDTTRISTITTNQGKMYAIRTTILSPTVGETHLAVSSDGLRTWQPIDTPILALVGSQQIVRHYWVLVGRDGQANLLADVGPIQFSGLPASTKPDTLWVSHDGGGHWTQLPAPNLNVIIAQTSADGHTWYICGAPNGDNPEYPADSYLRIACSMDGGETWVEHSQFSLCSSCISTLNNSVMASDGSLLILAGTNEGPTVGLYRLPVHSSQWQYLGPMPTNAFGLPSNLLYATTQTGDVLWSYAGEQGPSREVFYTATYPG
jgi:hypothetical protein